MPVSSTRSQTTTPAYSTRSFIRIDSPHTGDRIGKRFRATGASNVFEASMLYKLKNSRGHVVRNGIITATSGSGTPGTWSKTIRLPSDAKAGVYQLVVYNRSMMDGSIDQRDSVRVRYAPKR